MSAGSLWPEGVAASIRDVDGSAADHPRVMLPVTGEVIAQPNVKTVLRTRAQQGFRPRRLIVAEPSQGMIIHNIEVGDRELAGNPIPASAFSATAPGMDLGAGVVAVADEIKLTVSSPTGGTFHGTLMGEAVGSLPDALVEEAEKALGIARE
jgi:hypothetical protein